MNIEKLINNIQTNHMMGYFVEDERELILLLKKLVVEKSSVGCGDSITLEQTGVFDFFRNGKYHFYDKHQKTLTSKEKREIYIKNFSVDTFISSSNAISEDGKIFNIDGNGSRIAPIIYGPKQVIIVVGINKIVPTVEEAIKRTREIAAPMDAKRLDKNTPCTKTGKCFDCTHPQRICNDFVLITGQFDKEQIKIVIVNKKLGY
ncbi:MAG: lactate utilization protein [Coprobacillaceae bacterium]